VWTRGLAERFTGHLADTVLRLPVAHGEGRFVADSPEVMRRLEEGNQVALRYVDDPNGSAAGVAGICDPSGRIFGLMPHPERYLDWVHHPFWTRLGQESRQGETPGLMIFRNAVEAAAAVGA
jgi:phosphoribosylformylglycinamidine synthase subunit PurQ / glutaminase